MMPVITDTITFSTRGNGQVIDITNSVRSCLQNSKLESGILTVFVPGATAGVTTIEFESGAVQDMQSAIERLIPQDINYRHNARWHDGNGHSHVRAAFIGPDITVPFQKRELLLGTWQQIVFVDFDNRPRNRRVIIQILGE